MKRNEGYHKSYEFMGWVITIERCDDDGKIAGYAVHKEYAGITSFWDWDMYKCEEATSAIIEHVIGKKIQLVDDSDDERWRTIDFAFDPFDDKDHWMINDIDIYNPDWVLQEMCYWALRHNGGIVQQQYEQGIEITKTIIKDPQFAPQEININWRCPSFSEKDAILKKIIQENYGPIA